MDCIEPDQPLNDQVHRDDDIQQPRNDQDENAGNESDDGCISAAVMIMISLEDGMK